MKKPKTIPWKCLAGYHHWDFLQRVAGFRVYRCEHCPAERLERGR
ncbi:MAG TPA: hypothetical protein VM430_12610 [Microbacterium sp.]|nr:hypothetical protein [Microbacterium sp.]